ncbi:MAG TPA: ArsB/NhaD family transporter [Drouetiella sp.]|jgi:arsenical pump membrane protein
MVIPANLHLVVTLSVFVLTLVLVLTKPRGMDESWATVLGGSLMLLLGLENVGQAVQTISDGSSVLIFLLALCLFSGLLDKAGFFEWAALHTTRMSHGSGRRLYLNVFLLGGATTALLSLDTTAIILTPVVLSFVRHLNLKATSFLVACVFVSNTGSLLLPISNLTNLLFQSAFHYDFARFTVLMIIPQILALLTNYLLLSFVFRKHLPEHFDVADLPEPQSAIKDIVYFRSSLAVFILVLIGYFAGSIFHIQPYVIASLGCVLLGVVGLLRKQLDASIIIKDIPWSLFPFVAGLFVVIRGVENLGLSEFAAAQLNILGNSPFTQIVVTAFGAGFGSNVINNIPMALLAISVLGHSHASTAAQYGALLGCNLGPNLTVAGSLATMLVISTARKKGEDLSALEFFKIGLIITPVLLLVSSVGLWISLSIFP